MADDEDAYLALSQQLSQQCPANMTMEDCIASRRPPLRHPLAMTIPITLIYAILGIVGITGNVLVIVVFARFRELRTAANIYLLNLAVADLLLIVTGLPLELHEYWFAYPHPGGQIFGPLICIFRRWSTEASAYASVLTICAFTVGRALILYSPNKASSFFWLLPSKGKATLTSTRLRPWTGVMFMICGIWTISGACAALVSFHWRFLYVIAPDGRPIEESAICIPNPDLNTPVAFFTPLILFFVAPLLFITLLYLKIWHKIRQMSMLLWSQQYDLCLEDPYMGFTSGGPHTSSAVFLNSGVGAAANGIPNNPGTPAVTQHSQRIRHPTSQSTEQQQSRLLRGTLGSSTGPAPLPLHHNRLGGARLQSSSTVAGSSLIGDKWQFDNTRSNTVVKVQIAVTVTFFTCWAPFHAQRLIVTYGSPEQWTEEELAAYHIFNAIAGVLYYCGACANPIIYNMLSRTFRRAFKTAIVSGLAASKTCFHQFQKSPRSKAFDDLGLRPHLLGVDSAMAENVAQFQQSGPNYVPPLALSPLVPPSGGRRQQQNRGGRARKTSRRNRRLAYENDADEEQQIQLRQLSAIQPPSQPSLRSFYEPDTNRITVQQGAERSTALWNRPVPLGNDVFFGPPDNVAIKGSFGPAAAFLPGLPTPDDHGSSSSDQTGERQPRVYLSVVQASVNSHEPFAIPNCSSTLPITPNTGSCSPNTAVSRFFETSAGLTGNGNGHLLDAEHHLCQHCKHPRRPSNGDAASKQSSNGNSGNTPPDGSKADQPKIVTITVTLNLQGGNMVGAMSSSSSPTNSNPINEKLFETPGIEPPEHDNVR